MRHAKKTCKLGRTGAHKRAMFSNMLKSLIEHEKIKTTTTKAKELKRHADKMITLAKKDTLASKRLASGYLRIRYNSLTPREKKLAKEGDISSYNIDRKVISKLFTDLKDRYKDRNGGYTRLVKMHARIGDGAEKCIVEYIK